MNILETLVADVRFAARSAAKRPAFTAVAVATLALGVGATSALFSVIDGVLLRPLPLAHADRLVAVGTTPASGEMRNGPASYPDFVDYRDQAASFDALVAFEPANRTLLAGGAAEKVSGAVVSGGFFDALGVRMALGRAFGRDEDRPGGPRVAVLGHALWRDRFGGDPKVLGRSIQLDSEAFTVIGVTPAGFRFPWYINEAQIFTPVGLTDQELLEARGWHTFGAVGRLRAGVSLGQARAELKLLSDRLEKQYPDTNTKRWGFATPLAEQVVGPRSRRGLWMLMGAVVCLLLVACANVANLMLTRATEREREVAIRGALGADRSRLARQLLTESVFLGVAGGALGLFVAYGGVGVLLALAPPDLPRLDEVRLDHRVAGFTFVVSVLTGIAFGLAPSLRGSRVELGHALAESGRGVGVSGGHRRMRLRNAFIVAEVALALVLLTGAGLLVRSLDQVRRVDPGFDPNAVLTARIRLDEARYAKPEQILAFHQRLTERLKNLPGVTEAALAYPMPFTAARMGTFIRDAGKPAPAPGDRIRGFYQAVTPGYFAALKQPLKRGREFTNSDLHGGHPVVMLGESLAARLFPNRDALGESVRFGVSVGEWDEDASWEVIGIAADALSHSLDQPAPLTYYAPDYQQPWSSPAVLLRTSTEPMSLVGAVCESVRGIDNEVPVSDVALLADLVAASSAERRFQSLLLAAFSVTGLFLAAIGLYGVMSYSVSLQSRDIGIRLALGAQRSAVLRHVLRYGLTLAVIGVVIGLAASLGLARTLESVLFRVSAADPPAFGGAAAMLILVALAASYVPARRATNLDPMATLRTE